MLVVLAPPARRVAGPVGSAPEPSVAGWSPSPTPPRSRASRWKAPGSPAPRSAESFDLASRQYPIDLVFYDNQRSDARAVANAEAAIARKVDLYIQYHRGAAANATVAQKLKAAGIPVLAVDSSRAGRAALQRRQRGGRSPGGGGAGRSSPTRYVGGTADGRRRHRPRVRRRRPRAGAGPGRDRGAAQAPAGRAADDARHAGQSGARSRRCWAAFSPASPRGRSSIAATDDVTALAAKSAVEAAGTAARQRDRQPRRRSQHSRRRERSQGDRPEQPRPASSSGRSRSTSIALGYDVLPLAQRMLRGEPVPALTATPHKLITAGQRVHRVSALRHELTRARRGGSVRRVVDRDHLEQILAARSVERDACRRLHARESRARSAR